MNKVRIRSPWSQLALFLFVLGIGWIIAILAGGIIMVSTIGIEGMKNLNLADPRYTPTLKVIQAISTVIIFGFPAFVYAFRTFREHPLENLGFRPAPRAGLYLVAILLLFCSLPFEGWLGQINKGIPLPAWIIRREVEADQQIAAFLKAGTTLEVVINVFIIALLPAIFEEACFRGALQRILINIFKNPWTGIIVTAVFFSAFHFQFQGFLPRFFLGALLGAVYWYTGSLWASIVAHFFTNGIQVLAVIYYPQLINENPSIPIYTALISLVIVVGLLYWLRKQSTVTYAQVYPPLTEDFDGFPT